MTSASASNPPFYVVLNGGSGRKDTAATLEILSRVMGAAGRSCETSVVSDPRQLDAIAARFAARAAAAGGILVAAGGDGTLRSLAQVALAHDLPFGVLPSGTFNFFGRTHGIPVETEAAVQTLLAGRERPVQVGVVGERVFLVNASLGLYPQLLEDREAFKKKYGRNRVVAKIAGFLSLLRDHRGLFLEYEHEGVTTSLHTSTLFVGNSRLQLEQVGVTEAPLVTDGRLAAVVVRALGRIALLRAAFYGFAGALGDADGVQHFAFRRLIVRPRVGAGRRLKVATDGETCVMSLPLEFRAAPRALRLLVPPLP